MDLKNKLKLKLNFLQCLFQKYISLRNQLEKWHNQQTHEGDNNEDEDIEDGDNEDEDENEDDEDESMDVDETEEDVAQKNGIVCSIG